MVPVTVSTPVVSRARTLAPVFHELTLFHGSMGAGKSTLALQNAYNRQSEEGRVYNYNFTQSKTIPGLPIIPSVGVRGEI